MPRAVSSHYTDPLAEIWRTAAAKLGWRVTRAPSAYASWDGAGTLTLAPLDELDADDTDAQMILHEICHCLVAGPHGEKQLDWGLDNTSDRDVVQEHATNRLQAFLAGPYGLREFLAVTTEFRSYYDALPPHPLADGEDPAIALAQAARHRAEREPYASVIPAALEATAGLAALVRPHAPADSLWQRVRPRHSTGLLMPQGGSAPSGDCGDCAWSFVDGQRLSCRQSARGESFARVLPDEPGCERFEESFGDEACGECGACCREGFDLVQVEDDEPLLARHPELISRTTLGNVVLRPGGRCLALIGGGAAPYRCRVYDERPCSCRDFEVRGDACLTARRRVGLSA